MFETTIADWIAHHASVRPHALALMSGRVQINYEELHDLVLRACAWLEDHDVSAGARVVLQSTNRPEVLSLLAACGRLGAVLVLAHPRLSDDELAFLIEDARAHLAVLESQGQLEEVSLHPRRSMTRHRVDLETPALMLYTSGTTGRPRGAVLSHGNLLWNAIAFSVALGLTPESRNLACAPLFHVAGLNVVTTPCLHVGASSILHARFDPGHVVEALEEQRITHSVMVPAMWRRVLDRWEERSAPSDLRLGVVGGAPSPASLLETARSRGFPLAVGYGMTEASPMVSLALPGQLERQPETVGHPWMHTEVELRDEAGTRLEGDRVGELFVRSPTIMSGYWSPEGLDRSCFDDRGFFATGDLGHWLPDGSLRLVDRRHHTIISGGENIYPAEVERVLVGLDGVREAAVVGVPDDDLGQRVEALIVWRDAPMALPRLREQLQPWLARFKHPRRLHAVTRIPRTRAGKIDRPACKELLS